MCTQSSVDEGGMARLMEPLPQLHQGNKRVGASQGREGGEGGDNCNQCLDDPYSGETKQAQ